MQQLRKYKLIIALPFLALLILNSFVLIKIAFLGGDVENLSYFYTGGLPLNWYTEKTVRVCYDGCFNIIEKQVNLVNLTLNVPLVLALPMLLAFIWKHKNILIGRQTN